MNIDLIRRWIEALESGRYEQAQEALHIKDDGFCCLGVLCDLIDPDGWQARTPPEKRMDHNNGYLQCLSEETMQAVGLGIHMHDILTHQNDDGIIFPKIAQTLRDYYQQKHNLTFPPPDQPEPDQASRPSS